MAANDKELAYIAGFVDGEGCITISKSRHHTKNNGVKTYFRATLNISQKNPEILEWIHEVLPFGYLEPPTKSIKTWCNCWKLIWTDYTVLPILQSLLLFLRVKRQQAEIVIEFLENIEKYKGRHDDNGNFKSLPEGIMHWRSQMQDKIHKLNRGGK